MSRLSGQQTKNHKVDNIKIHELKKQKHGKRRFIIRTKKSSRYLF